MRRGWLAGESLRGDYGRAGVRPASAEAQNWHTASQLSAARKTIMEHEPPLERGGGVLECGITNSPSQQDSITPG